MYSEPKNERRKSVEQNKIEGIMNENLPNLVSDINVQIKKLSEPQTE